MIESGFIFREGIRRSFLYLSACAALCAFLLSMALPAWAQTNAAQIRYDDAAHTFRLDAADVSYVLGVNESGELQTLYPWPMPRRKSLRAGARACTWCPI